MTQHRAKKARNITLLGAGANIIQGGIKIIGGLWFQSHALIADGLHSLSDLLTDFMVLFASHYGSVEADDEHPYGHHRIETVATLLLSILLICVGVGICWDAFEEFYKKNPLSPTYPAFLIAMASIALNEVLFYMTLAVGNQIHSNLIKTNAWHHRSDSASSLVVALGILGALFGYTYLDAVAAIIISFFIIKMGWKYSWQSVNELIDTAVKPETVQQIQSTITQIPGVNKIHQLRTRSMGGRIIIDVHVLVLPYLSVSEGHYIAQTVHNHLLKQLPSVIDVTVHVDPEDDEAHSPSLHLPNRQMIEKNWLIPLQELFPEIKTWVIHYLSGQITIDLYVKNMNDSHFSSLQARCDALRRHHTEIKLFRFYTQQ